MRTRKAMKALRWTARISAALMALSILLFFIGAGQMEGGGLLLHLTAREFAMMVAFFALWLGLLLGWRWELAGGLLTVCGVVAFYCMNYLFTGTFPRGPFFLIFASPSLLFVLYGILSRKRQENTDA